MAATLAVLLVVSQSCEDATTLVIDNSPSVTKAVSFANDLVPLFNTNCAMAGCHNAGGKQPELTTEKAYSALTIGNYLNVGAPKESEVYQFLTGKKSPQMPMGKSPNPSNINALVLAWITQGAKNN